MAKKTVKKIALKKNPVEVKCPCCEHLFNIPTGLSAECPECGVRINLYENEDDADEAVSTLRNGRKEKLPRGGGWAVADCPQNGG